MKKRALMLTAATAALLSGQAYGATTCSTSQITYCDIVTGVTVPLYTGAVNPQITNGVSTASGTNTSGSLTVDTDGSVIISANPARAPAITIDSGATASAYALVNNVTSIQYTGVDDAVGILLEEAAPPTGVTSPTNLGAAETWNGEFYNSTGTLNLTGGGTNKVGILIAGAAYYNSATTGTPTNAPTGLYGQTSSDGYLGAFTGASDSAINGGTAPVAIYLAKSSTVEVQGTNSYGIELIGPTYTQQQNSSAYTPSGGGTLIGDIDIGGALTMTPTTVGSTTASGNVAINIAGWEQSSAQTINPALAGTAYAGDAYAMIGNLNIQASGVVSSEGAGAEGIRVLGALDGAITNYGTIETFGLTTASTAVNATDPEGGSALIIANNVTGGILNYGATSSGDTIDVAATISTKGTAPALDISSAANPNDYQLPITIGVVTADPTYINDFSLLNRGSIAAAGENANVSTEAIAIVGTSADTVTLSGGIFNSGAISSSATTNTNTSTDSVSTIALYVGPYVSIASGTGGLDPASSSLDPTAGQTIKATLINSKETGSGSITSTISGPDYGTATAVYIDNSGGAGNYGVSSIYNSGTIAASITTTTLTLVPTQAKPFAAYAINDLSGQLDSITNEGTISAIATSLNDNEQLAVAINTSSSGAVTIVDQGTSKGAATITGDIYFGYGAGTLIVDGDSANDAATVSGNIYFNNQSHTSDMLTVGANGTVTGEIRELENNSVTIDVQQNGKLNILSTLPTNVNSTVSTTVTQGNSLNVNSLTVESGGVLELNIAQGYNLTEFAHASMINALTANIATGTANVQTLQIGFGSFVASPNFTDPSAFVLITTPNGQLTISPQEISLLATNLEAGGTGLPFLFTTSICTYNVAGSPDVCTGTEPITGTNSDLVVNLVPKSPGPGPTGIGLTGNAYKIYNFANQALIHDNTLGSAIITDVTDKQQAQAAYSSFVPDLSGAARATAISLTDSSTNIVAARQRELRMYTNQEGGTTLWGQQFAQRLSENNSNSQTGYNDSGFGFALGMDDGDRTNGRYGGAFTFFSGGMSEKAPVSAKTSSEYYMLTGYTDWRGKGLFIDTQLSAGYGALKGRRYLTLTEPGDENLVNCSTNSVCREAKGNRPTEMLAAAVTAGGIFNAGATVFMPQISVDGLTMREEGYNESGGGQGFDLHVQPYYADSLRAFLGADMRQDINFGDFYMQPELRVGYRYDFIDGAVKLRGSFASVTPVNSFTLTGPDPGRGNIVLGGGVAATTGAWSLGVNFDYLKGSGGPTGETGVLTLVGRI